MARSVRRFSMRVIIMAASKVSLATVCARRTRGVRAVISTGEHLKLSLDLDAGICQSRSVVGSLCPASAAALAEPFIVATQD